MVWHCSNWRLEIGDWRVTNLQSLISNLSFLLLLTACTSQPAPPPDLPPTPAVISLRIGVASSAVGVIGLVTGAYGEERPFTHLQFIPANAAALWQGLADGTLDAALLHVIPADNDRWFNPVALDGLAVVVNPANPVRSLSLAQVQGLFSGQMSSWQEVGGKDAPVTLISREPGSGARTLLAQQVLGDLIEELKRGGVARIDLIVDSRNRRAIACYQRLGFVIERTLARCAPQAGQMRELSDHYMGLFLRQPA